MDLRKAEILQKKHLLLILAAIAAAAVFFIVYPNQNPTSAITNRISKSKAIARTSTFLDSQHFSHEQLKTKAQFKVNTILLDSLSKDYSRSGIQSLMRSGKLKSLPVYYWYVEWFKPGNADNNTESSNNPEGQTIYTFNLTPGGNIWLFNRSKSNVEPKAKIDRKALAYALSSVDSTREAISILLEAIPDTILEHKFIWDLNNQIRHFGHLHDIPEQVGQLSTSLSRREPLLLNRKLAEKLALYQLRKELPWFNSSRIDTIYNLPGTDGMVTRINIAAQNRIAGQSITSDVDIATTGGLVRMETKFNSEPEPTSGTRTFPSISAFVTIVVYVFLFIFFVYVFIRRIDARRFDTRNSIADGVLGWFLLVSTSITQQLVNYYPGVGYQFYLMILLGVVASGFIGAIGLFVVSGTAESIGRQYVPLKLETLSLARRGYLRNRPMGLVLFRGISFGLILCGITTLLLFAFPHVALTQNDSRLVFLADQSYLPFIHIIGNSGYSVILVSFMVFLGLGSYVYSAKPKPWVFFLVTAVLLAFLSIAPFNLNIVDQWILSFLIGLVIAFIYWRFDLLTVIVSSFTYFALWKTSTGWMIPNSPDLASAIVIWIILAGVLLMGLWSMYSSQSLEDLPKYIPKYIEEFTQKQRMQHELELARSVQLNFLPSMQPSLNGVDIVSRCVSAYETGGDYYDFIKREDGSLGFVIADVSGKGIKAAFYMTLLKGYLQCLAHQFNSPSALLTEVNTLFRDNVDRGIFVSMIYGIVDPSEKKLVFARAGHNPLIFKSDADSQSQVLRPDGLAVGMADTDAFRQNIHDTSLSLTPGNLISVYTDGFTEAMNHSKALFGDERLVDIIDKSYSYPTQIILDHVVQEVNQFTNGAAQHDDMTMILMKMK
ncbi:MAG TPA: SpoIIE family protein phosphatase [Balneolales bacterium]|nr:SpoIIE family protein phosphatase [Balneolales bacterium]